MLAEREAESLVGKLTPLQRQRLAKRLLEGDAEGEGQGVAQSFAVPMESDQDGSGGFGFHLDGILHPSSPFPIPPRCPLIPSLNHEAPWAWRGLGTLSKSRGDEKCLVSSEAAGTRTQDQRIKRTLTPERKPAVNSGGLSA
jgi:hypothetical protein